MRPRRYSASAVHLAIVCCCMPVICLNASNNGVQETTKLITPLTYQSGEQLEDTTTSASKEQSSSTMTIPAAIPSAFEAAFQGECRASLISKRNPCEHLCLDLHDGTYECSCFYGFTLAVDGYSCAKLAVASNPTTSAPHFSRRQPSQPSGETVAQGRHQGDDDDQDNGAGAAAAANNRKLGNATESGRGGGGRFRGGGASEQVEGLGRRSVRIESSKVVGQTAVDFARGNEALWRPANNEFGAATSKTEHQREETPPVEMTGAGFNGLEVELPKSRPGRQMDALRVAGGRATVARQRQTEAAKGAAQSQTRPAGDHNEDGAIARNWIKYNHAPKVIEFSKKLGRKSIIAGRAGRAKVTSQREENKVGRLANDEDNQEEEEDEGENNQGDWLNDSSGPPEEDDEVKPREGDDDEEEEEGDEMKEDQQSNRIEGLSVTQRRQTTDDKKELPSMIESGGVEGRRPFWRSWWTMKHANDQVEEEEDGGERDQMDRTEGVAPLSERIRDLDYDLSVLERLVGKTMGDYYANPAELDARRRRRRRRRRRK